MVAASAPGRSADVGVPATARPVEPPGPRGRFLAGNVQAFEEDRLGFLMAAERDYGPVVRFDRRTTIVNDPVLARGMLLDRAGRFVVHQSPLLEDLPEHEVQAWLGVRRPLDPALRPPRVEGFAVVAAELVDEVFTDVIGRQVPVPGILDQVTSRAIARYFFGNDDRGVPEAAGRLVDALAEIVGTPLSLLRGVPSPPRRRIRRRLRELNAILEPLVLARLRRPDRFADHATIVIDRRDVDRGQTVDRVLMALVGTMVAAHRVAAAASGWALMLSRGDGPTWIALQKESEAFRAARPTGETSLAHLSTTMAAVQESLRLYPPTWLLSREASSRVRVGGYWFGAGHRFLVSPYVLHRRSAAFPDPERFEPERWRETTPAMRAHYLPFGAGDRSFPGNQLATVMMASTILAAAGWDIVVHRGQVRVDPRGTLTPTGLALEVVGRR